MPRNLQGAYSLPTPPLQDGTNILVAPHNTNYSDLGAEITNSLDRAGRGGMNGQFKAVNGSTSSPGISYAQDTDTGFRRSDANTQTAVCGGQDVFDITPSGIEIKSGKTIAGFSEFPTGTKMLFVQSSAPTGWTKDVTHNNKALRIVSGDAGSGGSADFTTVFAPRTIAQANLPDVPLALNINGAGAHAHGVGIGLGAAQGTANTNIHQFGGPPANYNTTTDGFHSHTGSTSSINGGVTQQAMDFAVAYVDVIIASKD